MASSDTTFLLMAIAVLISSAALLAIALAALGIYRVVRRLEGEITPVIPEVKEFLQDSRQTIAEARKQLHDTGDKTQAVLADVRGELAQISQARADIVGRMQAQMQRVELVLDDSMNAIQTVVNTMQGGVIKPLREVGGILLGVRTAFRVFLKKQRPSVAEATQDEESFIG